MPQKGGMAQMFGVPTAEEIGKMSPKKKASEIKRMRKLQREMKEHAESKKSKSKSAKPKAATKKSSKPIKRVKPPKKGSGRGMKSA